MCYEDFSKQQHDWRPEIKAVWSKKVRTVLGPCVGDTRQTTGKERVRSFKFAPLADCRRQFANHIPDLEWEPDDEPDPALVQPLSKLSRMFVSRARRIRWTMRRTSNGSQ